jgi:dTDP-4-amino-4,6-dideoxygalactose transaminase
MIRLAKPFNHFGFRNQILQRSHWVNSRLDELQAAFLNVKLPFLDADNEHRAIAKRYLNEIKMKNHLTNGIN